jgi:hypothetical protein
MQKSDRRAFSWSESWKNPHILRTPIFLYFYCFPDEAVRVYCLGGEQFVCPVVCTLKMDLTEDSETSVKLNLTPGKYPKENIKDLEHGENLKSKIRYTLLHLLMMGY